MVTNGGNPFVIPSMVATENYDDFIATVKSYFPGLPGFSCRKKSIFFKIRPFAYGAEFPDPWYYKTGIFDGKFASVIGHGASGIVLSGEWFGKQAAFKFVEIRGEDPVKLSLVIQCCCKCSSRGND